jgi:site-specific DNA-methyltransferase (adenine-specific)
VKIETRKISDLTPDPRNARTHDDKNVKAIAASLNKFGQRKPIVITTDRVVLAGNGTVQAAKSLGWDAIDVVVAPADWDEATAKAFALADNRSAELAEWDTSVLASQLVELNTGGWDITALGFDMPEPETPAPEDDESLEPIDDTPPRAQLGDIYQLGRHRLMCGDSLFIDDVEKLTENKTIDMAFTDPPYGVEYTGGMQFDKNGNVETNNRQMIQNDDVDIYADVMSILSIKVDEPCYIWFADTKASKLYEAAEQYGDLHALIIWVKNGGYGALNANYKQKHEPCLYWKPKGATLRFTGATTETTIWEINKDGKNKLHPTQKPVDLAFKAIKNHEAKTVLDLFGGSGATLIAAEQLNRTCYMMELDPKYVDVIITRWQNLTGQKAELLPS